MGKLLSKETDCDDYVTQSRCEAKGFGSREKGIIKSTYWHKVLVGALDNDMVMGVDYPNLDLIKTKNGEWYIGDQATCVGFGNATDTCPSNLVCGADEVVETTPVFSDEGVVLHLNFANPDDVGEDVSGNNYNFDVVGSVSYEQDHTDKEDVVINNSVLIDGNDSYLFKDGISADGAGSLINDTFLNSPSMSIGMWINLKDISENGYIFEASSTTSQQRFLVQHVSDVFKVFIQDSESNRLILNIPFESVDEWVHFGLVMDSMGHRVYINGVLSDQITYERSDETYIKPSLDIGRIYIGIRQNMLEEFKGYLSDIVLSSSSWSDDQVEQLFYRKVPTDEVEVVGNTYGSPETQAKLVFEAFRNGGVHPRCSVESFAYKKNSQYLYLLIVLLVIVIVISLMIKYGDLNIN